jgi:flagellar motor switch protein FliM
MSGQDTLSQAEIDALLAAVAQEPTGGDDRPDRFSSQKVQNVDFRRQSKFNRDQLRTLEMLHETFSRLGGTYLSGALRSVAEISVLSAEQVTYGEFISSLPVPALTGILDLAPLETNAILAFDLPLVFTMIDRILGGPGHGSPRLRELTDIELQLSRTFIERLLRELSTSWSELVGVDFTLRHTEMNPQFAQIAPPTELSVLLSFQIRVHESTGLMALCLPWRSIEPVANSLTANSYFSGQRSGGQSEELRQGLGDVSIELRAEVGAVDLTIDEVLGLEVGDVIRLGVPAEEGVRLLAGPTATYRVFPGSHRRHLAVQVHDRIARPDEPAAPAIVSPATFEEVGP